MNLEKIFEIKRIKKKELDRVEQKSRFFNHSKAIRLLREKQRNFSTLFYGMY